MNRDPNDWDEEAFQLQQVYLERIQTMKLADLKLLHKDTFDKLKPAFRPRIPPWAPRLIWERRLFLLFAAKNYHFPRKHIERRRFMKLVKNVLTHRFAGHLDSIDKQVMRALNTHSNFTRVRINAMTEVDVDRYLVKLGYDWDSEKVTLKQRRILLWEYFNLPASETWPRRLSRVGKMEPLQKPRNWHGERLQDVILRNPTMGWIEFCDKFGDKMPSVTHGSFRGARYTLGRKGHKLPPLPKGRTRKCKPSTSTPEKRKASPTRSRKGSKGNA